MKRTKKILALLMTLSMMFALLVGCGNNSEPSANNTETPDAPIQAGDVEDVETGLQDTYLRDSVTMSASADGGTFDPYTRSSFTATTLIFQTLIKQDTEGNIRYEVAKTITKVDDLHYTIEIWDNIYDTDGNHLTASDIVFSIDTLIAAGNESQVSKLDHLEIVNDYTLTWVLKEPFRAGDLEKQMSDPKLVTKAAYESHDMTSDPVGTGAYMLSDYVPGNSVTIVANEDFWMKELPEDVKAGLWTYCAQNVREIVFPIIPDAATRAIALETGEIDIADALDGADASSFAGRDDMTVIDKPVDPPALFVFNCSEASPCADINLRKAICYALNNDAIAEGVSCPAYPVYGLSPRMYDAPDEWMTGREYYDYNVDEAKKLLAQSDYNKEELVILYTSSVANDGLALMMQSQLADLGINVKLYCVENSVFHTARNDDTQWDMRLDTMGGSNYVGKICYKFSSMDSIKTLKGRNLMMVEDAKLDELCTEVYADTNDETIAAWDKYMTYDMCYAYAVFGYADQTACRSDVVPAFGTRYAIMPNACTFTD